MDRDARAAVGQRELPPGRHASRGSRRRSSLCSSLRAPSPWYQASDPSWRCASPSRSRSPVATKISSAAVSASTASSDHAAHEALLRPPFEQRRARRGLEAVGVPQRGAEVGGGLAVGTEPRRPLARRLGVLEHGGAVVGGLGVMGEPRGLAAGQRVQRRPMEADAPVGRELVLDRRARDLVPEGDRVAVRSQHPGRQARLELRQLVGRDSLEQRRSPPAAARSRRPPAVARAGAGRRAARASTASRTLPGVPPPPCARTSVT